MGSVLRFKLVWVIHCILTLSFAPDNKLIGVSTKMSYVAAHNHVKYICSDLNFQIRSAARQA